jgi:hypothetical protein
LFAAIALVTCLAQPSNTFSGNNNASNGVSLAAAPAASPAGTYPSNPYPRNSYTQGAYTPYNPPQTYTPQGYPAPETGGQGVPAQQGTPSSGSTSGTAGGSSQPSSGGSSQPSSGGSSQPSSGGSSQPSSGGSSQTSSGGSSSSIAGTTTQSSSTGSPSSSAGTTTQSSSSGSSGDSSSSLSDVPGVPASFAACVAFRESTDLENPAADGNAYGIIPASGYDVYGTSLAYQKQVFAELYAEYGTAPWASDGCA